MCIMCLKVCLKPVKILKHKPFSPKSLISVFCHIPVDRTDLKYGLWCEMWYESADIKLPLLSIFCLCFYSLTLSCKWLNHYMTLCLYFYTFGKDKYISFYSCVLWDQWAKLTEVLLVIVVVFMLKLLLFRIRIGD